MCELVRKREKLKLQLIKTTEECIFADINPIGSAMYKILDQLVAKDTMEIFLEPVDVNEVPDYAAVIKNPIDLGTMREKLKAGQYESIDSLESDFNLMINNCLLYNDKETIFYKVGLKMREQGTMIFKQVRRELEKSGMIEAPITDSDLIKLVDIELNEILEAPESAATLKKLEALLPKAASIKRHFAKLKRVRTIETEIAKLKNSHLSEESEAESKSSLSGASNLLSKSELKTPTSSPLKASSLSTTSPSNPGVNRR